MTTSKNSTIISCPECDCHFGGKHEISYIKDYGMCLRCDEKLTQDFLKPVIDISRYETCDCEVYV